MEQPMVFSQAAHFHVARRRVKDAPTRAAHWWMAAGFAVAYITGDSEAWRLWHVIAGYSAMLALAFRVVWGFVGPQPARFGTWLQRGNAGLQWLRNQFKPEGRQAWLGTLSMALRQGAVQTTSLVLLLMLLAMPLAGVTGYITYNELAGEWMAEVHEWVGNLLLAAVVAHLGLLLIMGVQRRQNTASPMWSGKVAGAGPDLVQRNRAWLAVLLSAGVIGFVTWYWQDAKTTGIPNKGVATMAAGHDEDD